MPTVQGDCRGLGWGGVWAGRQPWESSGQVEEWKSERELQAGAQLSALSSHLPSATPSSGQPLVGGDSGMQLSTPLCKLGGDRAAISVSGLLVHCAFWNGWGLAAQSGQGPPNSGS